MLKTVVVAVDGSELAQDVIKRLSWLRIASDGQVHLVYVQPPPDPDQPADLPRPHPDLSVYLEQCRQMVPCACSAEMLIGDPASEIVRWAVTCGAQLIVIGSRGLTGFERILQRSVSAEVVAEAPCSVLVVHG
ncbi:MAG: universal stress protein [Gloeomargarita sp. SKYG116]|nr:universal stress protein [Gloeomargarita sp. SKYG116]MDW8401694.1 universal stress protein [Gloeomargarita sp. SKYGB_i_bin116]